MDSETIGIIDNIEKIKGVRESSYGGILVVVTYKVNFHFVVDKLKMEHEEFIHYRNAKIKQHSFLKRMSIGDTIRVKYDSKNTKMSKVMLE